MFLLFSCEMLYRVVTCFYATGFDPSTFVFTLQLVLSFLAGAAAVLLLVQLRLKLHKADFPSFVLFY